MISESILLRICSISPGDVRFLSCFRFRVAEECRIGLSRWPFATSNDEDERFPLLTLRNDVYFDRLDFVLVIDSQRFDFPNEFDFRRFKLALKENIE